MLSDKARAVEDLVSSVGWEYVKSYLQEAIDLYTTNLLSCELEDVMFYRGKVEALKGLLCYIESVKEEEEE